MYELFVFWTKKLIRFKIFEISVRKGKHLFPSVVYLHDDHITIY